MVGRAPGTGNLQFVTGQAFTPVGAVCARCEFTGEARRRLDDALPKHWLMNSRICEEGEGIGEEEVDGFRFSDKELEHWAWSLLLISHHIKVSSI